MVIELVIEEGFLLLGKLALWRLHALLSNEVF
jgi:hypothetical protein